MSNKGIMEEISEHLSQGRSSRELIDLGYRPGSVYGALRQVRQKGAVKGRHTQRQLQRKMPAAAPGEDSLPEWPVWHIDPPLTCPGCEQAVVHWRVCPRCNDLLPLGCACGEESSPSFGETYSLCELCSGVSGRSLRITDVSSEDT